MEANKYRSSGAIDAAAYREVGRFALSRGHIWFFRIAAVLMGLLAVLMLIARDRLYMTLLLAFAVLFALSPKRLIKGYTKGAIKRLEESCPSGYMQMETWFTDEGVVMHNLTTGGQQVLAYGILRKAAETEHYFYLATKANQFTLVFKDLLTPEQQQSFLPFLREKCPKLKVVR